MKIFIVGDLKEKDKNEAPLIAGDGLFNALLESGHDIYYLTYFKEGYRYNLLEKLFGYEEITDRKFRCGLFPLLKIIFDKRPDLVHFNNVEFFYIILYLVKPFIRFKVVYTVHGLISYEYKHYRRVPLLLKIKSLIINCLNFTLSDRVIFLSEKTSRLAGSRIASNKKVIMNNGVKLTDKKKNYFESEQPLRIAFAVNMMSGERKEKGLDLLIKYLCNSEGSYIINIYGSNFEKSEAVNNVLLQYHNFIEDANLNNMLLENDLYIAPSRCDTFNMSLLKAMELGMLFISSDRVGLTERFDNDLLKFVYRYNNQEAFINTIKYIKSLSPNEKEVYSELIKNFAGKYSWESQSKKYYVLYESCFINEKK